MEARNTSLKRERTLSVGDGYPPEKVGCIKIELTEPIASDDDNPKIIQEIEPPPMAQIPIPALIVPGDKEHLLVGKEDGEVKIAWRDEFHTKETLGDQLLHMQKNSVATDCQVLSMSTDQLIPCHRVMLAKMSPKFEHLLVEPGMILALNEHQVIVNKLIDYAYTSKLHVYNVMEAELVYKLAKSNECEALMHDCVVEFHNRLNEKNIFITYNRIDTCDHDELDDTCRDYICTHLESLLKYQPFVYNEKEKLMTALKRSKVRSILAENQLQISSELPLLQAVEKWAQHIVETKPKAVNHMNIRSEVQPLLSCLRILSLEKAELDQFLKTTMMLDEQEKLKIKEAATSGKLLNLPKWVMRTKEKRVNLLDEILTEETPVEETPVEETPTKQTPAKETPAEEVQTTKTPVEEVPQKKVDLKLVSNEKLQNPEQEILPGVSLPPAPHPSSPSVLPSISALPEAPHPSSPKDPPAINTQPSSPSNHSAPELPPSSPLKDPRTKCTQAPVAIPDAQVEPLPPPTQQNWTISDPRSLARLKRPIPNQENASSWPSKRCILDQPRPHLPIVIAANFPFLDDECKFSETDYDKVQQMQQKFINCAFDVRDCFNPNNRMIIPSHRHIVGRIANKFNELVHTQHLSWCQLSNGKKVELYTVAEYPLTIFIAMLNFLYLGWIEFENIGNAMRMCRVVTHVGMKELLHQCMEYMAQNMTPKYAWEAMNYAAEHGNKNLTAACTEVIQKNWSECIYDPIEIEWRQGFLRSSLETLEHISALKVLDIKSEIELIEALKIKHAQYCTDYKKSTDEGRISMLKVIKHIRFFSLTPEVFGSILPTTLLTEDEKNDIYKALNLPLGLRHTIKLPPHINKNPHARLKTYHTGPVKFRRLEFRWEKATRCPLKVPSLTNEPQRCSFAFRATEEFVMHGFTIAAQAFPLKPTSSSQTYNEDLIASVLKVSRGKYNDLPTPKIFTVKLAQLAFTSQVNYNGLVTIQLATPLTLPYEDNTLYVLKVELRQRGVYKCSARICTDERKPYFLSTKWRLDEHYPDGWGNSGVFTNLLVSMPARPMA